MWATTVGPLMPHDPWGHDLSYESVIGSVRRQRGDALPGALRRQGCSGAESNPAGGDLLHAIAAFLGKYVAFPSQEATDAVALWTAHTHALDAFESTPRLALLSPEKQSGKTRTLEVLELLCPKTCAYRQSECARPVPLGRRRAADSSV